MRIYGFTIENIRGIKTLTLEPDGNNLVVWGPNGSGKSAVVDAIDFLLTGRITRLIGEGTKGITLKQFGPHIDNATTPRDCYVSALVKIPGREGIFEIKRCIASPGKLEFPGEVEDDLMPIIQAANKGQHVLSRREILKFITAESGRRAEEIMSLLNLRDLETIRKSLVTAANRTDQNAKNRRLNINEALIALCNTLELQCYDEERVKEAINELRSTVGRASISEINSQSVIKEISIEKNQDQERKINSDIFRKDIDSLSSGFIGNNKNKIDGSIRHLIDLVKKIRENEKLARELSLKGLLDQGLKLF